MRKIEIGGYTRINKRAARNRYYRGEIVHFCPVNLNPIGMFTLIIPVTMESGFEFDKLVTEFEYYNCMYSETGLYTAFYVKDGE